MKGIKKSAFLDFLHSEKGQRFFNFAYSIGAAIVIWGALFKILHLPGGNALLCIGMGTEIMMFVLTAFDRPSKEYAWEEVFPALDKSGKHRAEGEEDEEATDGAYYGPAFGGNGGGTVIIGGGSGSYNGGEVPAEGISLPSGEVARRQAGLPDAVNLSEEDTNSLRESIGKMAAAADQLSQMAELTTATQDYLSRMAGIADQMTALQQTTAELNHVSSVLLDSYKAITDNSTSIAENSNGYVESMADLNRNIGGLNTIYEIQLKSISSQLESIDRVNRGLKDIRDMYEKSARESSRYCEETEKMARYMKQLNSVYEKMITAMTINMYNPMMGGQKPADVNPFYDNANSDNSSNS